MKAENLYLLPAKASGTLKGSGLLRTLLVAFLLLLSMPGMAQYFNVATATGTTTTIGGVDVTVSDSNGATATNCGYGPYKEGNGGPGYYKWAFSIPIVAVRMHITAIGPDDIVSIMINGVNYPLAASQVNPLPVPCSGTTAIVVGGVIVTGGGNSDATVDINPGYGIDSISIVSNGASGVVASDFNFEPILNNVPSFVLGSSVARSICQDAPATDYSSSLSINDLDVSQTETWTIASGPAHGTVVGFSPAYTAPSNGGIVTSGPLTYQPNAGFSGADSFIVKIDDGTDTSVIMVHMTVNPTPDVTVSSSQTKCNLSATDSVYFTGTVSSTTYNWVNDNTSTGLAATGNGDIPSFIATNTTFVPVVSTVTVTPTALSCPGAPKLFTITVNPTPDVNIAANVPACNNTTAVVPAFASDVTGTTYTWTNDNSSIGLATTGTGNIASFPATDTGTIDSIGNIVVIPTANGCDGNAKSFTITIHPTPVLTSAPDNNTSCDNTEFFYAPLSATPGTTYMWERAATGGINNGAGSGTDTIRETLDNTTTGFVSVAYVYTLTANTCTNVQTVTDTVIPTLLLTSTLTPDSICNNVPFDYLPTSNITGAIFHWNRNAVTGISNSGTTGASNPLEELNDTTALPVLVTYNYDVIYDGCHNTYNVAVQVNPSAKLTTTLTPAAICDSTLFTYGDSSLTSGTTYSWSRAAITGIANPAASGVDTIKEVLINDSTYPVRVVYFDTLTAYGCQSVQTVTVTVNPRPVLSSPVPAPICSNTSFDYIPASATLGTTFAWSRAVIADITNPAAHDTGSIHEVLVNPKTYPVTVLYIDTLTINGCTNTDSISVVVNPIPKLSSIDTPAAICNGATFNYTPLSLTTGATFNWTRPSISGIDLLAGSGSDNPNEQLIDSTNFNISVVYVYTVTANGCNSANDTVTVVVHPTLRLSTDDSVVTCSNELFNYKPESYVSGVTFAWSRAHVAGILPSAGSNGTFAISEILVDTAASDPIYTIYKYKLTLSGCTDSQSLTVRVNAAPSSPSIAIKSPDTVCSNTQYQNFGALTAPATGSTYIWSAINATVMATGNNKQNALVTFNNAGDAKVILTSSIGANGCKNADTFSVSVNASVSEQPNVIYYNGQFMCLQNEVGSYQWGYDDALTLDSALVAGEVNQTYFNSAPDLTYKHYWVMTTHNGCMQKAYYNAPEGVINVNTGDAASVKVYPNPATANINVEINTIVNGDIQVEVMNLLGQKVGAAQATDRKATISVANLPAGYYLLNCYHEGVKIATAKFIKN